jgi:hypothetical protein
MAPERTRNARWGAIIETSDGSVWNCRRYAGLILRRSTIRRAFAAGCQRAIHLRRN